MGKTTINPSISLLVQSHQPVWPSAQANAHVAITQARCSERQVQQNMILCIRSIFRRHTPGCGHMNSFPSDGVGGAEVEVFSGYDCRGWLPQIPPAQRCEAEVERDVSRMEYDGEEVFFFFSSSRCDPHLLPLPK